ncbi:MAG TPA: hypothetical protein VGP73_00885 [Thermoanaerobaculia bacterium]
MSTAELLRPPSLIAGRPRAVYLTLGIAVAGWVFFLVGEACLELHLRLAEAVLPRNYANRFFILVFFLLALIPALLTAVGLAMRRKQVGLLLGIAIVLLYLFANFLLLRWVRPFFGTGFLG